MVPQDSVLPVPGPCPFFLRHSSLINGLLIAIARKNHLLNWPAHYVFDTGVVTSGEGREWVEEENI